MPDTNPTPVDSADLDVLSAALDSRKPLNFRERANLVVALAELRSARAAIPGPDSERAKPKIANVLSSPAPDVRIIPVAVACPRCGYGR